MRGNGFRFRAEKCCLKNDVFEEIQVLVRHKCFGQLFTKGYSKIEVKFVLNL